MLAVSHVSQNPTIFCSRFVDEDDRLRAFSLNSVEIYRKEPLLPQRYLVSLGVQEL